LLLPAWLALPAWLLLSSVASAAGLGRLSVQSYLGQPLRAEIEVVAVQPGEAESLKAALASQEAFRQANIDLNSALFDLRFEVERRPGGQFALKVSSPRAMNEPFLDMLVELTWTGGRLTREYTFLLDPPEYRGPAVAQPVTPPAVQALPAPSRPAPEASRPAPAARAPAAPPPPVASAAPAPAASGSYEVKRGDTLGKIARANAQPGVSMQQMLAALYRANQDAFMGNNMNRLRAGRILNIPDREAALSISAEDARRMVNAQGADYAEFQRSVGASVASAPARQEPTRQSAGRITQPSAEKTPPAADAQRDQLRLSKPDDAKAGGRAAAAASADDQTARDKALKDSQERVAALEKNVQDLQKLLTLKSAPAAQAQQQADASKAAPKGEDAKKDAAKPAPDASKAPAAPAAEAPKAAEPAKPAEPATGAEAAKAPAPDAASAPAPEGGRAPDTAKAAPKAAPKAPPAPPPSVVEKDPLDELLDNEYAVGGALLVVLLLIGYALYAWRRKKQADEERFGPSVIGPGVIVPAGPMLATAGEHRFDPAPSAAQMDFSAGTPKAGPEEIDPVAEADVYMAYGRDAQAEEILKEALAKDPGRIEVRMKLLEVYASRKDPRGFESTARELHTATGGQGADWDKAAAMGLQIDPSNTLYGGRGAGALPDAEADASQAEAAPAAVPPLDFDLDGGTPAAATQPDFNLDEPGQPAGEAAPASIDFDLGLGGDEPAAEPAKPEEPAPAAVDPAAGLDFDLGLGDEQPAPPDEEPKAEPEAAPPAADSSVLDFDLNLGADTPAEAPAVQEPPPEDIKIPELDLSSITFDMGSDTPAAGAPLDAKWQEVATKLDLAKAYEEMGDKDGARDLLNEVVQEGDAAQQEQAKTMLAALG
jgi:pilus assembly protein FimV